VDIEAARKKMLKREREREREREAEAHAPFFPTLESL